MSKRLPPPSGHNHPIATLSPEDQGLLHPHLNEVALDQGMALEEPGQPIERVVFPVSGVMSLIVSGEKTSGRSKRAFLAATA
jgi:hypothetical protein